MGDTVCDHVVDILKGWGVDTVFGLPGDGINGFVESLRRAKDRIRFIHCRHEEAAAMAACGYAKFTGRLGVVFSTAAPGAVHLLNGLYDAKIDGAPVLAITGMTYHDLIGTHYLQDINQDYLFQNVAAYNQRLVAPEHVENVVNLACRNALAQRAVGHVAIPIDIQAMAATDWKRFKRNVKGHTSRAFQAPRTVPERRLLEEAAKLLAAKKKVAILAGAGARGARSELEQIAERLGAPIVKALLGKECVPDDSPYTTGGIGVVGTRPSVEVFRNCDALLIVGSCFPYIEFLPKPAKRSVCRSTISRNGSASATRLKSALSAMRRRHCVSCSRYCRATRTAASSHRPSRGCTNGGHCSKSAPVTMRRRCGRRPWHGICPS
jgi:pyruvate dehydrogenase (quinone)